MSDANTPPVTEPTPEVKPPEVKPPEPTEPVTPPAEPPSGDVPAWGQQLTDTVNSLAEIVKGLAPKSPELTDETPQSVPWTHWNPFKR